MKKNLLLLVFRLFVGILFLFSTSVYAQVEKQFIQRTSQYSPSTKLYYLKGNFAMIGNTNMRGVDPNNNNNNGKMEFVDVDNVSRTINSSRAVLTFPMDYDANPECSEVVYAGLYWSGRSDQYPNGQETWLLNADQKGDGATISCYKLRIASEGEGDNNVTTYTFAPNNNQGVATVITFTGTASNYSITATVGTNDPVIIPATVRTYSGGENVFFDPPYEISSGSCTIPVAGLRKVENAPSSCRVYINKNNTAVLSKHKVLFKYGGDADNPDGTEDTYPYQTVTASSNDIFYPVADNDDKYIYVAYAEVTDYVKEHGLGNYFVGNIGAKAGTYSSGGFFGGWGLIVVYRNDDMKWREVTIFDGYAGVEQNHNVEVLLEGLNSVQYGDVTLKLGLLAAEGDRAGNYGKGDAMQAWNKNTGQWDYLVDPGYNDPEGNVQNFFNSSIHDDDGSHGNVGGRDPYDVNNYGIDIHSFDIPNSDKQYLDNNDSWIKFKFTSTQDRYSPFCLAFAMDAYIPEAVSLHTVATVNGIPADQLPAGYTVEPGEVVSYSVDVMNKGTETIDSLQICIPVPYTAEYVSHSAVSTSDLVTVTTTFDASQGSSGIMNWDIDQLPAGYPDSVFVRLNYYIRVTDDCSILMGSICDSILRTDGYVNGVARISRLKYTMDGFIVGYEDGGACDGNAIYDYISMHIDRSGMDYCSETGERSIKYCNVQGSIPIEDIASYFPNGCRFYDSYDETAENPVGNATEYLASTGIPIPAGFTGTKIVYAVYPHYQCFTRVKLIIDELTSTPIVGISTEYCLNDVASPLGVNPVVTPSDPSYTLYYYTSETGGYAQPSITPSTTKPGTFHYWVAEGSSTKCISSNRVMITIEVWGDVDITHITEHSYCEKNLPEYIEIPYNGKFADLTGSSIFGYDIVYDGGGDETGINMTIDKDNVTEGYHTFSLSITDGHLCDDQTYTDSIYIFKNTTAPVIGPNEQEICNGTYPAPIKIISEYNGTVVDWEYSDDNGFTWEKIINNTDSVPSHQLEKLYYNDLPTHSRIYHVRVSNGLCDTIVSNSITIRVMNTIPPEYTVSFTPSVQYSCYGAPYTVPAGTISSDIPSGFASTHYYEWYDEAIGGNLVGESQIGGNGITVPKIGDTYNTYYVAVKEESGCAGERTMISIRKSVSAGAIVTGSQIECSTGQPANVIGEAEAAVIRGTEPNNPGALQYKWSVINSNGDTTDISGATTNTYTPSSYMNTEGTYKFIRWVKGANCDVWQKSNGMWTLVIGNPNSEITNMSGNNTFCDGSYGPQIRVSVTDINSYNYKWYYMTSPDGDTIRMNNTRYVHTVNKDDLDAQAFQTADVLYYKVKVSLKGYDDCYSVTSTPFAAYKISAPVINDYTVPAVCENNTLQPVLDTTLINCANPSVNYYMSNTTDRNGAYTLFDITTPVNYASHNDHWLVVEIAPVECPDLKSYDTIKVTVNPLPEVSVTNNVQTICMDNQIQEMEIIYSNGTIESVTGLPENVNWSDTPSGATIFGAPAEYGTFNATVTVTSDQGCGTATADVTITVKPNPEVTVSNNFQTVCENSAITAMEITATHATIENVTGLPTGVSWSKDSSGATGTISGTPTASGTYNVTVTVNSDQTPSCGIAYAYVRITVNPLPEVTVTNDNQTVCAGDAIVAMEITATNATIANVEGLPAGVTWSGTMISGTPTESGTFNVTVMVDSYYGCGIGMAELTIIVNPLPEAYTLDITGYGDSDGGWNLIASPLAESIAATEVGNLVAETASDFDLYRFNQAANMEWENWKQEESEHYHFNLESGQGYLYASKEDVTLTFLGTPNSDDAVNVSLSYTEGKPLAGFNLVGNPFTVDAYVNRPFYKMNDAGTGIEAIENYNDYTTAQTIPACTGIVVKADNSGESVIFSTTAPSLSAPNNGNLQITLTQANTRGNALLDNAIVSFNEGSQLGKFYFGEQNGNIYIPQGGKEFAIAYSEGMGEMPLNFKARKNGEYTITVNPDNVEMSFLHLIDNLTGADVDLLQTPSYTFSARNDDYASRFKLVFKALGNSSETEEDFAFISNGEIIINGKGIVQVIDLMGRIILADEANRNISTKGFVSGVYVLRLIDGENAKTQKIVIQ